MATFPENLVDFRAALLAWTPHPTVAAAIAVAHASPIPPAQVVQTFEALKSQIGVSAPPSEGAEPTPVLGGDGLRLLAGAAFLIHAHTWYGLAQEAYTTLGLATAALAAAEA